MLKLCFHCIFRKTLLCCRFERETNNLLLEIDKVRREEVWKPMSREKDLSRTACDSVVQGCRCIGLFGCDVTFFFFKKSWNKESRVKTSLWIMGRLAVWQQLCWQFSCSVLRDAFVVHRGELVVNNGSELPDRQAYCHSGLAQGLCCHLTASLKNDSLSCLMCRRGWIVIEDA